MKCSLLAVALVLGCLVLTAPLASASIIYTVALDGVTEFPANASPGTGTAQVTYDDVLHTLHVQMSFAGLLGTTTACHIHGPTAAPGSGTAGVITTTPSFAGFPLGVTSGAFDNTLDLTSASSWNPSFVTANGGTPASAEVAMASSMAAGTAYLNIHTSSFAGGEIRGFLLPEPAALSLLAMGALATLRRRK